jgi:hypothetical protein
VPDDIDDDAFSSSCFFSLLASKANLP